MKLSVKTTQEVPVKYVRVVVPVRYDDEDIPYDFPLREKDESSRYGYDRWACTIELNTGKILEWTKGKTGDMFMKVCDEGTYKLLDERMNEVASIEDYVPNGLIPPHDGYGDYIHLVINEDGIITNWYKRLDLRAFEQKD